MTSWSIVGGLDDSQFPKRKFRHLYFAGMGGSSLPADLINDYLENLIYFHPIRDYSLPPSASSEDLVLCASFSGNTEETLAALEDALAKKTTVVCLSNGGKLKKLAEEKGLPFIPIPDCIQPRCATGYFFASTLALLHRLGVLESKKSDLEELAAYLKPKQEDYEAKGKEVADFLKDRVPIIYGPTSLQGVCRIWKIKINENAKVQSFYNVFPELNHNEMVGYTKLIMKPAFIYLKSSSMAPQINKRMEVMKKVLGENIPILELSITGKNLLQEFYEALAIGDYTSYHLAKSYGMDPAPVAMVEDFKKLL